jgi:NTE family protein
MRVLVLGGGGNKGAGEAGVLDYLLEQNSELDYDAYVGISVGAINAAFLASGPFNETFPKLKDIWLNKVKGNKSVWTHHIWHYIVICIIVNMFFSLIAFGTFIISAPKWVTILFFFLALLSFYLPYKVITNTHSIYKTDPLRKLISENLDVEKLKNSGKKLAIGTVSFTTGQYKSIKIIDENIIDWIMASSAFPIFFPMQYIDGEYWTDGGVVNMSALTDALDLKATEIDIIITSPLSAGRFNGITGLLKQMMRNIDVISSNILQDNITVGNSGRSFYGGARIRYFIFDKQLSFNSLDFDVDKLKNMFNEGRKLGKKVIEDNY